jgi:hypothetical protein
MVKQKSTNQLDISREAQALKRLPGRPPRHMEPATSISVVLLDRHDIFLRQLSLLIRQRTGARVSKSEILRALTQAVAESEIDLTTSRSEAELKEVLLSKLRKRKKPENK